MVSAISESFSMATYKYYLLGDTVPIRVSFNDKGHEMGAQVPNKAKGELVYDGTYLSRIENSYEVEEITAEDFDRRCSEVFSRKIS